MLTPPHETFARLTALDDFVHAFTLRNPEINTLVDREAALQRLWQSHTQSIEQLGYSTLHLARAEQVHGSGIAVVTHGNHTFPNVDGLICNQPNILLGIYVADCCAVYLADPVTGAFGVVHSGKNGSALGITRIAIEAMQREFGSTPEDIIVQLSPCIRPPAYEIDFAAMIRDQAKAAGILPHHLHDDETCTASDLNRYYSYRAEKGKTGRMLALLGRKPS